MESAGNCEAYNLTNINENYVFCLSKNNMTHTRHSQV